MAPSVADRSRVTILQAIILGLVEGVTEYLPVSSTGHLILTAWLLGLSEDAAKKAALDSFNIVIQGGAILAVLGLYRARVAAMVKGLSGANHAGLMLFLKLIVAFLPAAVLGLMFNKAIKELGLKGVSSQTQGEQVRVTGKKRDDLQAVIAGLKEVDLEIPLQFENFRD